MAAWEETRQDILKAVESTNYNQRKEREEAYLLLRAMKTVRGKIESHIRAAHKVQAENSMPDVPRVAELGAK